MASQHPPGTVLPSHWRWGRNCFFTLKSSGHSLSWVPFRMGSHVFGPTIKPTFTLSFASLCKSFVLPLMTMREYPIPAGIVLAEESTNRGEGDAVSNKFDR